MYHAIYFFHILLDYDNWAAIETILNYIAFPCGGEYKIADYEQIPCKDSEKVRKDFEFLFSSVVELFKIKLSNNETYQSPLFDNERKNLGYWSNKKALKKFARLLHEGVISKESLQDLAIENIAKIELSKIFDSFQTTSEAEFNCSESCQSEMQRLIMPVYIMLTDATGTLRRFGTFLSNFAEGRELISISIK